MSTGIIVACLLIFFVLGVVAGVAVVLRAIDPTRENWPE